MSYRNAMFDPAAGQGRRYSLAGQSTARESREQVLARTHLAREKRRMDRERKESAIRIQAAWRSVGGVRVAKDAVRRQWFVEAWPTINGSTMGDMCVVTEQHLRELLFFYAPRRGRDRTALAVCAARLLTTHEALLRSSPAPLRASLYCAAFSTLLRGSPRAAAARLGRQRRPWSAVLDACQAVSLEEPSAMEVDSASDDALEADASQAATLVLAELALKLALPRKPIRRAKEPRPSFLARCLRIVGSVAPGEQPASTCAPPPTLAQALATALVLRLLGAPEASAQDQSSLLRASPPSSPPLAQVPPSPLGPGLGAGPPSARDRELLALCARPDLWSACPSLVPVRHRVWRAVVLSSEGRAPAWVAELGNAASLPGMSSGWEPEFLAEEELRAAVLANLLAPAAALLPRYGTREAAAFATLAAELLGSLLEVRRAGPEEEEDEDEEEEAPEERDGHATVHLPPELTSRLAALAEPRFLRALADALLPAWDAEEGSPPPDAFSRMAAQRPLPAAPVLALCRLLLRVLRASALRSRALVALGAEADLLPRLWARFLRPLEGSEERGSEERDSEERFLPALALLGDVWATLMVTAGDEALLEDGRPVPVRELPAVVRRVRDGLWLLLWAEPQPGFDPALLRAVARLARRLHAFNERREAVPGTDFEAPAAWHPALQAEVLSRTLRARRLLRAAPFLAPFMVRARALHQALAREREAHAAEAAGRGPRGDFPRFVSVRRDALLEDAWAGLGGWTPGELRGRVRVQFVSAMGLQEAGVDGGGVFKEFLEQLVRAGFDPAAGLFAAADDGRLFPLPGRGRSVVFETARGAREGGEGGTGEVPSARGPWDVAALPSASFPFPPWGRREYHFRGSSLPDDSDGWDSDVGAAFPPASWTSLLPWRLARGPGNSGPAPAPSPPSTPVQVSHASLLHLLGSMLGKALWEGILVDLPLAAPVLKALRGAPLDASDLAALDPRLHRSLRQLQRYPGEVAELGLFFALEEEEEREGGEEREEGVPARPRLLRTVELVPGGSGLAVTSANVQEYCHRVTTHRLRSRAWEPCLAFARGFHSLVPAPLLAAFDSAEVQALLSGGRAARLDVADARRHARYGGGYDADSPQVLSFWRVVEGLQPEDQAALLRFWTSCPRAPLLGFQALDPPLTIQRAGGADGAVGRLPTAATCVNLLKLPPYPSEHALRERVLYAIHAGAGFELS